MSSDPKLDHAEEFTDIEDLTLDLWLQLELANLDDRARALLHAGLMLEHYTSLLSDDLSQRTPAQIGQLSILRFKLADEVRLAQDELGRKRPAVDRWEKWLRDHK